MLYLQLLAIIMLYLQLLAIIMLYLQLLAIIMLYLQLLVYNYAILAVTCYDYAILAVTCYNYAILAVTCYNYALLCLTSWFCCREVPERSHDKAFRWHFHFAGCSGGNIEDGFWFCQRLCQAHSMIVFYLNCCRLLLTLKWCSTYWAACANCSQPVNWNTFSLQRVGGGGGGGGGGVKDLSLRLLSTHPWIG